MPTLGASIQAYLAVKALCLAEHSWVAKAHPQNLDIVPEDVHHAENVVKTMMLREIDSNSPGSEIRTMIDVINQIGDPNSKLADIWKQMQAFEADDLEWLFGAKFREFVLSDFFLTCWPVMTLASVQRIIDEYRARHDTFLVPLPQEN